MKRYFPQLDGLRALAAFSILAHHYWPDSVRIDFSRGRLGVDLFFVLSGFLITRSLYRSRVQNPGHPFSVLRGFYRNRLVRIVPLYYVTLLLACGMPTERHLSLLWHFCFLSNIYFVIHQRFIGAGGHLWALAVEQQFYLFWPLIFLWVPERHIKKAAAGMLWAGLAFRGMVLICEWTGLTSDLFTATAFEALGCGALLGLWMRGREAQPERLALWISAMGAAGILLWLPHLFLPDDCVAGHVLYLLTGELSRSLLLSWIVVQAVWGIPGWIGHGLQSMPLKTLGRWSYGIYLSHNFFLGIFRRSPHHLWHLSLYESQVFWALSATLLWGAAGYYLLEGPLTLLAKRWSISLPHELAPR